MDIDYIKNNYRFNARVSAIIYNRDRSKVLFFKIKDRDYYMLPGGRINMYEDSESAIKREILEETGFNIDFKLASIQENFLLRDDIKITQYCFVYKGIYDKDIEKLEFNNLDNNGQIFYWINSNELDNIRIYPKSNVKLIEDNSNDIKHVLEKATLDK